MVMTSGLTGLIAGVTLAQVSGYALRQYSMAFLRHKPPRTQPDKKYRLDLRAAGGPLAQSLGAPSD
jgi:hypothetical protein